MANIPIYKLTPTEAVVDDTLIKATPFVTGYTYGGSITPSDTPLTEAVNAFYLASTNGTYTNFGGLVVSALGFIYYKVGVGYSFQAIDAGGGGGGSNVESGDGMDFITNDPVTLGLPSTIDSTTKNAVTETSHTHKLEGIDISSISKAGGYGALYNFPVMEDSRNISSNDDWIVATKVIVEEMLSLISTYDEGTDSWLLAADKLRESGFIHWDELNTNSINTYNFSGVGSGNRALTGVFYGMKSEMYIHTSTIEDTGVDYRNFRLYFASGDSSAYVYSDPIREGISIRLTRLATESELLLPDGLITATYVGNNAVVYGCTKIGNRIWITSNLNETKYRNGDWITGYDDGVYTPISDLDWAALTTEAMCYYDDNEEYGGGEVPLSSMFHSPVTIHPDSTALASIDENQVLKIEAQGGAGQSYQVLTAKDIEAGTAQAYDLIIKARQDITIESIVVECDDGTLTGCTVTIGATAITFASGTFSVSTTLTEIAATADNVASAGDRVKINTSTGYTGTPTVLNVQLNYTVN